MKERSSRLAVVIDPFASGSASDQVLDPWVIDESVPEYGFLSAHGTDPVKVI
jgi:hypothetical protein